MKNFTKCLRYLIYNSKLRRIFVFSEWQNFGHLNFSECIGLIKETWVKRGENLKESIDLLLVDFKRELLPFSLLFI